MVPHSKTAPIIDNNGGASIGPLPFPLTALIGRTNLVDIAVDRLASPATRLLTFVGPGGIGKSRLALEVAHKVSDRFRDGALLVRLAAVTDPSLVRMTIARALGIGQPDGDHPSWAIARDRQVLLLVDNFEQVLSAAPDIVEVLTHCRYVTMLVTSRVPLHVTGEHEFQVPPLSTSSTAEDMASSDAALLFAERAQAALFDFQITPDNGEAVAEITRQLDGLPLAIELAAAQSKLLTPTAIADRLRDRTVTLQGGPIDLPPHQRAMRETIAWSYDLLETTEQERFRRLAVFHSGFQRQAASYVCLESDSPPPEIALPNEILVDADDVLDTCISLADKSLLFRSADLEGEPRFAMLLTIGAFAQGELRAHGEWERSCGRHAAWYLAFASIAESGIESVDQKLWLRWVDREHPNLRAALEWFRDLGDWRSYALIANGISNYWTIYGHHAEGLRWLIAVIDEGSVEEGGPFLFNELLCAAGWLAYRLGNADQARDLAARALTAARASHEVVHIAETLNLLAYLEVRATNYKQAESLTRESLAAYREINHPVGIGETLISLGRIELDLGDFRAAERRFRDVLDASDPETEVRTHARALDMIGVVFHTEGRPAEALTYAQRAHELYRVHGDVRGTVISQDHIGKCARALGDVHRAWECHRQSLQLRREVGDPRGFSVWLEAIASLLVSCGAYSPAAQLLAAVDAIRTAGSFPAYGHERVEIDWAESRIRHSLSREAFREARDSGSRMSLADAVDFALLQAGIAVAGARIVPAERDNRHGLTAREQEVLSGLERRLTDREIGVELSISSRTASTHVASILSKLNLKSRRDLPALRDSR